MSGLFNCQRACLLVAVILIACTVRAEEVRELAVRELAAKIDRHLSERWASDRIVPAEPASDAEFLRRVTLHVAGTIPTVFEVRQFLNDSSPDKRQRCVERLLESPQHLTHFTAFFRQILMPEASTDFQARGQLPGFEAWLRQHLSDNTPYDRLVRELLTVPLESGRGMNPPADGSGAASPVAFFQSKQVKPENLAAATSRMFLGLRIECAQCHDHPQDIWKRQQFWGTPRFLPG